MDSKTPRNCRFKTKLTPTGTGGASLIDFRRVDPSWRGQRSHHRPRARVNQVTTAPARDAHDTQTGMLPRVPGSARCVQRFDDSLSVLQFTSLIAFSHVLHRCGSREIRRQELLKGFQNHTAFDFIAWDKIQLARPNLRRSGYSFAFPPTSGSRAIRGAQGFKG